MIVRWIVECETAVDTDDRDVAREQVYSLFENKEWGQLDGCELCFTTVEHMRIEEVGGE